MATVNPVIIKHHLKSDNTWSIKIRISHNQSDVYIDTHHIVGLKQVDKNYKIKDQFVLDLLFPQLKELRDKISVMPDINYLTAQELKQRLTSVEVKDHMIDFLGFSNDLIRRKIAGGKESSARSLQTVVNSLSDYFNTPKIAISEIDYKFLVRYEEYLRRPRKITRKNHSGLTRRYIQKGVGDAGLHNHMRDLRLLFNEARNHYNDEDRGIIRIPHYPFKKYKIGTPPLTENRDRTVHEILIIRDAVIPPGTRAELARDLFMLSFYMLGMNAADIYEIPSKIGARIDYNRSKTRNKRKDKAFISVKVTPEARILLKKYAGKLNERYSLMSSLNTAIDKGLKGVSEITGIPNIDFYDARHSVGTLARNTCGFSFEDVAIALNQKERTVTDIYIAPDWSTVDKVQEAVTGLLR